MVAAVGIRDVFVSRFMSKHEATHIFCGVDVTVPDDLALVVSATQY